MQKEVNWQPKCSQIGKHVQCFQSRETNRDNPLESRVRCVIMTVLPPPPRDPPVFVQQPPEFTWGPVDTACVQKSVSIGGRVEFDIVVEDPQPLQRVSISAE